MERDLFVGGGSPEEFANEALGKFARLFCSGPLPFAQRLEWQERQPFCELVQAIYSQDLSQSAWYQFADAPRCKAFLGWATDLKLRLAEDDGPDPDDRLLEIHEALAEAMAASGCCWTLVERLPREWIAMADPASPLRLREDVSGAWQCLEWTFWGSGRQLGSPYGNSLRGVLWQHSLKTAGYWPYSMFETLTVQFAYLPLCVHYTKWYWRKAALTNAAFRNNYANCMPTHMSYAIDHFLVARDGQRAQEAFDLMRAHPWRPVAWESIHNTAVGYLPGITHWPWWQEHPAVAPYIEFLEKFYPLFAEERAALESHPGLLKNAFPATSSDLAWHKIDVWESGLDPSECAWTPRLCEALAQLNWQPEGDIVDRKFAWNIVDPGCRLVGHSGQSLRINVQLCVYGCEGVELHLNGRTVEYQQGKAVAWQDGWRHEGFNKGKVPRWMFMITIPHPEYEAAWKATGGDWPQTFRLLNSSWRVAGAFDRL